MIPFLMNLYVAALGRKNKKLSDHVNYGHKALNLADVIVARIRRKILNKGVQLVAHDNRDTVTEADIVAAVKDLKLDIFLDVEELLK